MTADSRPRIDFCESATRWLAAHPDNVVGVHCKAGKGRSGMMACCLMLKLNMARDAAEAIQYYGMHRTSNKKALTVPSQKRYVRYYQEILRRQAEGVPIEGEWTSGHRPCES